ncbi:AAA family ATPase [Microbacterium sp. SA39]|uniref:AAA family ATPase n=1 Tax=Microbacterium sp. SA39 TaxID=1263625 RepID=UPI0005FA7AB4|nr:AAA family ATPase [Microbacterium sp. SA39]KJQ56050.1 Thymidylate kinase [Microbacterium sp. SA39]
MSDERTEFLRAVVALMPIPQADGPNLIVGIDGVDGSGKTTLADELAALMPSSTRVSIDGYHHVRERRYRRGRSSPEGFWLDSYDYERFRREVIDPFRRGHGTYLPVGHDVDSDELLTGPRRAVPRGNILLVDGIFLHRPELVDVWDLSIFLDVPFAESVRRMSVRDGLPPDPDAVENARYVGGQKQYLAECRPAERATILVDYEDLDRPSIRRP